MNLKTGWYWKEKVSSSSIQHQTNWKSVSSTKAKDKKNTAAFMASEFI